MPRRTIAKATDGWMPTITVSAPRSRAAWARLSRVREPKESMTSRAATSMMTPLARWVPICSTRSCWNWTISRSFSASWIEAMRYLPCRRIETSISTIQSVQMVVDRFGLGDLESEQALRLFDAALEVADSVHLAKVDPDGHQGLGDLGGQAGEDHAGPHQPGGVHGLDQVVGDLGVDVGDAGDVQHHHLGPMAADAGQQLLGELVGALLVQHPDDGQDEDPLADLEHRGGQLPDRLLLLADDAFAFADKAHRHGVGDTVGGRLIGVQDPVQQLEVLLVLLEQRPGQDITQQQHDADDLIGLHPAGDDPL